MGQPVKKTTPEIQSLLQFFSNFNEWENREGLFRGMSLFLDQQYGLENFVVVSLPEGFSPKKTAARLHWVFKRTKDTRPEVSTDLISELYANRKKKSYWSYSKEQHTYGIFSDCHEGQFFLCHFSLKKSVKDIEQVLEFLAPFFAHSFGQIYRWRKVNELKNLIHVDDVTGLYNQRKLVKDLDYLVEKYKKDGNQFSVFFIDIDHFKHVNDGHGHLVGTQLLMALGKVLKLCLRESDLIYRYGGDEFVIVIPDIDHDLAISIGDRILTTVKDEQFKAEKDSTFKLSVSIGIAHFPQDASDRDTILAFADQMMYHAKSAGRGRVSHAVDLIDTEIEK